MPVAFDLSKCDGCGICDSICPGDVIHMHRPRLMPDGSGKTYKINPYRAGTGSDERKKSPFLPRPQECWHCGSCRQDCPQQAISIVFPPDVIAI
jgi:NAD-dependent dihydropyrimidine dehydrogenase PreA subunit